MANLHNFGTFATIEDAWKIYPNGGGTGDYITVGGIRLDWNGITRSWGVATIITGQFDGDVIDHPVVFENYISHLGDITVGVYSPSETGAMIETSGDAEFRTVKLDSLSIQTNDGYITLADYIENLKADSKHDWEHINNLPIPPDTLKIVIYDTANNLKYYTTIGQLKNLFKTDIPEAVTLMLITSTDVSAEPNDTMPFSSLRTMNEISQINGLFQNHITDTSKHLTTTERNWLTLAKDWFTEERIGEAPNQTRIIRANFDFYSVRGVSAFGVGELAGGGGGAGGAGYLYELGDLALSNVQDDDVLMFDASIIPNGKWTNKPFPTFSQYLTQTTGDARYSLLSHSHTKAQITDFAHSHTKTDITDFAHTHTISDITSLQDALNSKLATSIFTAHDNNATKHITAAERTDWNSKLATSIFAAHAANQTTNVKHLTDAQLSSLIALASYWKLDNDGNLYTERNVYSTGEVSAYGSGASGAGGGGVGSLVTWGTESAGTIPLTVEGISKTLSLASHTHSGYLTSETDPTVPDHVKEITLSNISNWNSKANGTHWHYKSDILDFAHTHNFSEIGITGLTANYLTKFNGSTLVNSSIFDNGTNVGIGGVFATPNSKLQITGGWLDVDRNYGFRFSVEDQVRASIRSNTSNEIRFSTGSIVDAMVLADSGFVGIGTTDPTATLDVNGIGKFKDDILMPFKEWSHATDKNSLNKFLELFDIDTAGNLVVKTNLYSTGEIAALGAGTGVSALTLTADMNANGKNINNLTSISKSGSKINLLESVITFDLEGYNNQLMIASDGIYSNAYMVASSFHTSGMVESSEFKFGNWTFKQDVSGRLGIYNGASEVACFNTDGTYVNL